MKKLKVFLFLAMLSFMVVSCQIRETNQPTSEEIPQAADQTAIDTVEVETVSPAPHATERVFPTRTQTPSPKSTPTTASWVLITPNMPVPLPTAKAQVAELLNTNGGCLLPCWWGIVPGETSYTNLFNQFSQVTTLIAEQKDDGIGSLDAEFLFPGPETISSRELSITFIVEKGVIRQIEVNPGIVPMYRFNQLLEEYGNPAEVWIEGIIDPTNNNPFTFFLFYPKTGIIATYWADAIDQGDSLQVCLGSISPNVLILWEPGGIESFLDITATTYDLAYINNERRSLVSLEQATGKGLNDIGESGCFETPRTIWPAR